MKQKPLDTARPGQDVGRTGARGWQTGCRCDAMRDGSTGLRGGNPRCTLEAPGASTWGVFLHSARHGGDVSSLLDATPPPSRSGPKAPRGGGGGGGGGHWEGGFREGR